MRKVSSKFPTTIMNHRHHPHSDPSKRERERERERERDGLTLYRDDPKLSRKVTLKALSDPLRNHYCPVKLILALSLRVGNITGTSVGDVLSSQSEKG